MVAVRQLGPGSGKAAAAADGHLDRNVASSATLGWCKNLSGSFILMACRPARSMGQASARRVKRPAESGWRAKSRLSFVAFGNFILKSVGNLEVGAIWLGTIMDKELTVRLTVARISLFVPRSALVLGRTWLKMALATAGVVSLRF
jgi:hypothetical protein